jgi:DNA-binding transcriptional MerR regulator
MVKRSREFAELGGVTVKALMHYDRLGLLTPARTNAGHRAYSTRDLERLRRILALKTVGVPLREMRSLLDSDPAGLRQRLAETRAVIDQERERLNRTDRAVALVEESLQHGAEDGAALGRLADVIAMSDEVDPMHRYFSDEVWPIAKRFYDAWPTDQWIAISRDIASAIGSAPTRDASHELLRRWNETALTFWQAVPVDLAVRRQLHEGFALAWRDRANWPAVVLRRFSDYRVDDVAMFVGEESSRMSGAAN